MIELRTILPILIVGLAAFQAEPPSLAGVIAQSSRSDRGVGLCSITVEFQDYSVKLYADDPMLWFYPDSRDVTGGLSLDELNFLDDVMAAVWAHRDQFTSCESEPDPEPKPPGRKGGSMRTKAGGQRKSPTSRPASEVQNGPG